jgi:hypothetical protein
MDIHKILKPDGTGPAPLEEFEKQLMQDEEDGKILTFEMDDNGVMQPVDPYADE